jgi:hypothetical protein
VWVDLGELLDLLGQRRHGVGEDQPRHPLVAVWYRQRAAIVLCGTPPPPHPHTIQGQLQL